MPTSNPMHSTASFRPLAEGRRLHMAVNMTTFAGCLPPAPHDAGRLRKRLVGHTLPRNTEPTSPPELTAPRTTSEVPSAKT